MNASKELEMTSSRGSKVAEFIAAQIELSEYSQREIADICGFSNANVITMIKQGRSKLPLDKIGVMAEALGIDPVRMLKLTLLEYQPGVWQVIEKIVGFACTENEKEIIELLREVTDDTDPRIRSSDQREALIKGFNKLKV